MRILLLTGSIYQVKKRLREKNADSLDRQRARWLESRKPYDRLNQLISWFSRRHGADSFGYFEWFLEKLMHDPAPEDLEALLPANGIKTRPAANQNIESRVAQMPQPPDLW